MTDPAPPPDTRTLKDGVTVAVFGALAVGAVTVAILERGGDPVIEGLPEPTSIRKNATDDYHAFLCAEIPATPPREVCEHKTTRSAAKAAEWEASDSYTGSTLADIAGHPASMTPRIWGNDAPE